MRGTRGASRIVLALALAATGILFAAQADAGKSKRWKTFGKIEASIDGFSEEPYVYTGKVRSRKDPCLKRTVVLYNEAAEGPLGDTKSDPEGNWEIRQGVDTLAGEYYAVIRRKQLKRYTCLKHTTNTVPAAAPN